MFRLQLIPQDKAKEKIDVLTQKKDLLEEEIQVGILSLGKQEKEIRSIVLKRSNNVTLQNTTPQSIPTSISTKATSSVTQPRPQIPAHDAYEESNYDDDVVENSSFQGYNHLNSDYDDENENNHSHVDNDEEEKIITLDDIKSIFDPTTDKKFYDKAEMLFDQADTGLTDVSVETKFNDLSCGNIYKCYYRGNDKDQESQEQVTSLLEYLFIVVDRRIIGETSRSRSTTSKVIYDIVAYKKPNSMRRDTLESSKVQKKLKFYLQTDKKVDTNQAIMDEDDEDLEDDEDESLNNNNNNRNKKNTNELPTRQNSPRKAKQQKTA